MVGPEPIAGTQRTWRVLAWLSALSNAALAAMFVGPALTMVWTGASATSATRSPEEYGAAMIFATLGGMVAILALILLMLAVASWLVARRLRRRAAGLLTFTFLAVAGLGPPALLVGLLLLR